MVILDNDESADLPSLSQLLRDWWARLQSRFGRQLPLPAQSPPESQPVGDATELDRSEGLLL